MRFEAINMRDSFRVWKLALMVILVGITVLGCAYLAVEIPRYLQDVSDPLFGFGYFHTAKDASRIAVFAIVVTVLLVGDVALCVFIHLLGKWEKDAKGYGLALEGSTLYLLCEGRSFAIPVAAVERFEVGPKNSEPTVFRSKWAGVGWIMAGGATYKLYYLKNLPQAKAWWENERARVQG